MNSEFAVSFFISIIKFVFKFTIFTVNMNSSNPPPSKKKKKETLSKKTFNKWCCGNDFDNEVDSDDNVVKVTYQICTQYLQQIRVEARATDLRGLVVDSLLRHTDGVNLAHKGNIEKHTKSGELHDWAKKKFSFHQSPKASRTANVIAQQKSSSSQSGQNGQASTIVSMFYGPTNEENYCRLIVAVIHIALNERPLSDFPDLINLQKKKGLEFLEGKSHEKVIAEYIDLLAEVVIRDIKNISSSVHFFSIAMDGSQPQKTGTAKALLYGKVVVRGQSAELLLECIHVDDYGGDAKSLKHAVDVLLNQYNIPENIVDTLMVCCCTDGARVNMGKYNGKGFCELYKYIWKCTCDLFLLLYYVAMTFFCKVFICEGRILSCFGDIVI